MTTLRGTEPQIMDAPQGGACADAWPRQSHQHRVILHMARQRGRDASMMRQMKAIAEETAG